MLLVKNAVPLSLEDDSEALERGMQVCGLVNAAWDKVCWACRPLLGETQHRVCITTEGCLARGESIPYSGISPESISLLY